MPSPFVTDPPAIEATKVPWPAKSRISVPPVKMLCVSGSFAARSGAVTSAPVSITAIVTEEAARRTESGTALTRAAVYCHWYGTPAVDIAVRPGSAAEKRRLGTATETLPGGRDH